MPDPFAQQLEESVSAEEVDTGAKSASTAHERCSWSSKDKHVTWAFAAERAEVRSSLPKSWGSSTTAHPLAAILIC